MKAKKLLERIILDPNVMTGKPVIRGTRLTVQYILGLLAHGASVEEILDEYKGLNEDDIKACLLFATESLENTTSLQHFRTTGQESAGPHPKLPPTCLPHPSHGPRKNHACYRENQ